MPVQPDPTHPKFLEGDDVLVPPKVQDDDVQGHLRCPAAPRATPSPRAAIGNTDDGEPTTWRAIRDPMTSPPPTPRRW